MTSYYVMRDVIWRHLASYDVFWRHGTFFIYFFFLIFFYNFWKNWIRLRFWDLIASNPAVLNRGTAVPLGHRAKVLGAPQRLDKYKKHTRSKWLKKINLNVFTFQKSLRNVFQLSLHLMIFNAKFHFLKKCLK